MFYWLFWLTLSTISSLLLLTLLRVTELQDGKVEKKESDSVAELQSEIPLLCDSATLQLCPFATFSEKP